MRTWVAASGLFFLYTAAAAGVVPGLPGRRRALAAAGAALGLAVTAAAHVAAFHAVLHEWILPPVLLLTGYWVSGLLFAAPMPGPERALLGLDRTLRVDAIAAALPRWAAELLEAAYVGIYPLIPAALAVHLLATPGPDAARFWAVVLVTDFACFAFLPWVQTRPPRAFLAADPWTSRVRRFNLRLLGRASIQVNTFPSGHAAEAVAAALLVSAAPWPIAGTFAAIALLISAGAVLGRYHYAGDALAGWGVALGVWMGVQ